jgi:hypothetical protein
MGDPIIGLSGTFTLTRKDYEKTDFKNFEGKERRRSQNNYEFRH